MAHGIRNVSKGNPCPICGKPDWCGFMPDKEGGEVVFCQRNTEKQNIIGYDGKYYIYVASTRSDAPVFEEAGQRMAKEERWKTSKKYDKSSFKKPSFETPSYIEINKVDIKSNEELDKIYRALLDMLVLDDIHKQYLKEEGWSDELIEKNNIKSFPEKDFTRYSLKNNFSRNIYRKRLANQLIEKFGKDALLGVPGAYKDSKGNWTFAGAKGILFPVYDANHNLYRLRIRMDFLDVTDQLIKEGSGDRYYNQDGKRYYVAPMKGVYLIENGTKHFIKGTGKYRNLSSFHDDDEEYKKGFIVNTYDSGCEAGNQVGFYYNPSRDNMYLAFVTEGEKKSIFGNDKMRAPFVNIPGVNSWYKLLEGKKGERGIDILRNRGVKMFIIAFDADKAVNSRVLETEAQTIQALKDEGFLIGVAEWDINLGKGIDDLLHSGHQPNYYLV